MNRVLIARSFRDDARLLAGCCALALGFTWLRVWVASHIKVDAIVKLFPKLLPFLRDLLPVPIEDLASPLGRVAFSYEESVPFLVLGLWTVTRGSDCIAGRIAAGTMEMILAQPVRRLAVVASHTLVTLAGVVVIAAGTWCGIQLGLVSGEFDPPPGWRAALPGLTSFLGLGVFFTGSATLFSSLAGTRAGAVGLAVGLYIVEVAFAIAARLSDRLEWLRWLTILTSYQPTLLTVGLHRDPAAHWPLFWIYNAWLFGLGGALLALGAVIFCRRDVPAPQS